VRVALLEEVPSLGRRLPPSELDAASKTLSVAVMELTAGRWKAPAEPRRGQLGLVVLDGIVLREICISRDWSAELLGEGDMLRPWVEESSSFVLSRWEILEPARLAVLDAAAASQVAKFPGLVDELFERTIRRSRSLAVHALIEGVHRIDQRLLLLFWHLAEQRGERSADGVVIPVRLTHGHLARLIGARRPTVTTALGQLRRAGQLVRKPDGGWLLSGEPPEPGEID
jgi:CRP/FNR family transcriptional regulator, cyclic AMP receptor protein